MTQHVLRVDHVEVNVNVEGKILDGARHGHCGRVKVGSIAAVAVIAAVVGALQFAPAAAYARAVALKHESRAAVVLVWLNWNNNLLMKLFKIRKGNKFWQQIHFQLTVIAFISKNYENSIAKMYWPLRHR